MEVNTSSHFAARYEIYRFLHTVGPLDAQNVKDVLSKTCKCCSVCLQMFESRFSYKVVVFRADLHESMSLDLKKIDKGKKKIVCLESEQNMQNEKIVYK